MMIEEEWKYCIRSNGKPNSIREWIGDRLRGLAQRIDARLTLALSIESTPYIPLRQRKEIVMFGIQEMERALATEAKERAREKIFVRLRPELFEDA